jgi:hypothetical protein
MSKTLNRKDVIHAMLNAYTDEEIKAALAARDAWLKEHPGDYDVIEASESLNTLASVAGIAFEVGAQ